VLYLATRASQIFANEGSRVDLGRRRWDPDATGSEQLVWPYRRILQALLRIDEWLEHFPVVRANRMRLIWGFEKPATPTAADPHVSAPRTSRIAGLS
jgi:hypothetical protein